MSQLRVTLLLAFTLWGASVAATFIYQMWWWPAPVIAFLYTAIRLLGAAVTEPAYMCEETCP